MCLLRDLLLVYLFLSDIGASFGSEDAGHHSGHRKRAHKSSRRYRAADDGAFRFEPQPYSRKLELNSSGKIHCKVAGGVAPSVQWYLNDADALPEGVTSLNGTLVVAEASRRHGGQYTCKATDGDHVITSKINVDIVVLPRVIEPAAGEQMHVTVGDNVALTCRATGEPQPATQWDRNRTMLRLQQDGADIEDGVNASSARVLLLNNGTLLIRNASEQDSDRYGCIAGSFAGLDRSELLLVVHPEGELSGAGGASGVGGRAVLVSVSVAAAYMLLVLALMLYCRRRRLRRRQRGEKEELEMAEGREKLVEEGDEDKKLANGAPVQNGRLLPHDRDSGADNSEVSAVSRASKKSGQFEHLSVPRSLLTDLITLGRGEFGEVLVGKVDLSQLRRLRHKEAPAEGAAAPAPRPVHVLVKALTTKDEAQLAEFRRQLDTFGRARHENVARLLGLCSDTDPHYMLLEHTDWGDLKNFLIATRTPDENEEYLARVGPAHPAPAPRRPAPPPSPAHRLLLCAGLARAAAHLASHRLTHRDIAARNCVVTSKLSLKLSLPALSRGPDSYEYYKLHDQVIPLRWMPVEAVLEGDYSTKSDVYSYAATVWEIYTKAELPFGKLNDNSVLERLKAGTLDWPVPDSMPELLAELLKRCWSKSPSDRPQFSELCEEVNTLLQSATADAAQEDEDADT